MCDQGIIFPNTGAVYLNIQCIYNIDTDQTGTPWLQSRSLSFNVYHIQTEQSKFGKEFPLCGNFG